jgi:hypothetical protein
MLLPPPRPMSVSIPAERATTTHASTSSVVGFSRTWSNTAAATPAASSERSA